MPGKVIRPALHVRPQALHGLLAEIVSAQSDSREGWPARLHGLPNMYSPALPRRHAFATRMLGNKGISQVRLALLAGVDRSYFGQVERKDNNIGMLTLHRIALASEVTAELMMTTKL
jgi:hypothetical protein